MWINPTTPRATNLAKLAVGDALNLEFDLIGKYVERLISRANPGPV